MKNLVRGIIFWIITLAFIFVMWTIAEALSKIYFLYKKEKGNPIW